MVGLVNWLETPEIVPVLSRGKHRSPRKGACFMEYVSFLAGERWSDHPTCTHGLLAGVARGVNDHISDSGRSRLVELIPSVVGVIGDDPAVDAGIAARCAAVALPVVANYRQRALAAGLLTARKVLADLDDGSPDAIDTTEVFDHARCALSKAPHAAQWAEGFIAETPHVSAKAFRRRSAPAIVRVAVTGIAEACIPDPDSLLYELLAAVIDDCTDWLDTGSSADPAFSELTTAVPASRV
jgi:hypothetical protein